VPVGRLEEEESRDEWGAKRGEESRAGVAGDRVYMLSRFKDGKSCWARLSDEEGSKRPTSSNRGVSWKGAPKSSPSAMRGLVKSGA